MKKLLLFAFLLITFLLDAQSSGEIISFEQKLDLTPEGVTNFISESTGNETPAELLEHVNSIPIGLIAYKLTYYTKDYDGNFVKATGLVMYPKTNKKLSTILYCHPTTDKRENVPSNLKDVVGVGFVLPLTYALNQYIVVAPDFYGMGDGDGTQNYGEATTTADSIVDMMTASQTFLDQMNIERYNENFITGYSLGAHAGMATLRKTTQENSYYFEHAYLGAGPMDMSYSTLQRGVIDKEIFPISAFLANIVYTADKLGSSIRENNDWGSVIQEEYLDSFIDATVEDNGGIFWGPVVWRKLFTERVVNGITYDANHPLRIYLEQNNVYDWYNTTPTTLTDGFLDTIIHPSNNATTKETQQSYYPWWSFSKYKIKRVQVGPFSHITGILPWILGSVHRFNTIRRGGYFNLRAEYTNNFGSKIIEESLPVVSIDRSSIDKKFLINGKEQTIKLSKITGKTQEKKNTTLNKNTETGIYLAETKINNKSVKFPYVIEEPIEIDSEILLVKDNEQTYIDIKDLQTKNLSINIFNKEGNKVTAINSLDKEKNLIPIKDSYLTAGNTIEIITPNNIFMSRISATDALENNEYSIQKSGNRTLITSSTNTIKNIEVYNILGKLVHKSKTVNSNNYFFKTTKGINIIKITNTKGEQTTRKVLF